MICFNLDRSTATQFGKPSTIKEDLYVSSLSLLLLHKLTLEQSCSITRNAKDWYKKSQYNHPVSVIDVVLCGRWSSNMALSMMSTFAHTWP